MRYWVFKHGAKDWGADIVKKAYKNNYCYCQFEYRIENSDEEKESFQDTGAVTKNWKFLQEVKVGDVIILSRSDFKFAWGYVIKPRFSNPNLEKKVVNCNKIIQEKYNELRSDNYYGYVEFEDCECFYENLEDGAGEGGQRIDVKKWNDYKKDGIYYPTSSNYKYNTIQEISKEDALNIVRALKNDPNFQFKEDTMEDYKKLLESNYNLILTGAPGTGKTHLAKEIAKEMMKDNTHIKDYKQFIIDYYNSNKERLDNLKKEGDKLREEFINKFPIESLKNISIDDYAVGRGDNNSFCYWIEFGLKRKLLGGFFAGGAKTYLLYYDKKTGNLVNETDKTDDELIKEIGKELYNMATIEDYDFKDSVLDFNKRNDYMAIKIYNTYHPYTYFPMLSREYMLDICSIFNIEKNDNRYKLNKNIKKFFDENLKDIDSYIVRRILLENFDLISGKKQDVNMMNNNDYGFVQFHPSYDYTDFVEGLRPVKDSDGKIGFERKDGIFKKFCKEALKNRSSKFVFIIDEINRGEISKIFGELFFAVDPGYRGESGKVQTQYNNLINNDEIEEDDEFEDGFFVPENVYIIGTMNDIDRSVESMDFAMRRRFAWKEVDAKDTQEDILKNLDSNIKQNAIDGMNALNNAISEIEGFNSSYHIGASYFLKLKNYYNGGNIEEAFNSLWENHLRGLLYEYLRGMPDAESKLEELKNAYNSGYASNTQTPNNQQSSIDTEKVNDGE
ncbi:AAA family ATPase [Brachyspira intermedia]|uniref:AAA family ATPase n=1 Tax=Brachyspira intermedia TaxID=84377 RepID=UPI003004F462